MSSRSSGPQMAAAASRSMLPAKNASRDQTRCSAGLQSSWLQSMHSRRVCCRVGAPRPLWVSSANRSASRSRICDGDKRPQPRRGEFDSQGQPVQPPADVRDVARHAVGEDEAGGDGGRPFDEQRDGVELREARGRDVDGVTGDRQRGNAQEYLTRGPQRLSAGAQDVHAPATAEHAIAQRRDRVDDLLAVVEEQQAVGIGEHVDERVLGGLAGQVRGSRGCP